MSKYKESLKCSFCGKDKKDALMLIAGIDGHICETCVEQAYEIINEELKTKPNGKTKNSFILPSSITPLDIKSFLDQYIIGQNDAKMCIRDRVWGFESLHPHLFLLSHVPSS